MKSMFLALALLVLGVGCASTSQKIDDTCIAGKLTEAGASILNGGGDAFVNWNGTYVKVRTTTADDRILSGTCSAAIKGASSWLGGLFGGSSGS